MQASGAKGPQVRARKAHPISVYADQPRARRAVSQDPCVCPAIRGVVEPAVPAGLVRPRFVLAVELHVLVGQGADSRARHLHPCRWLWLAMKGRRIVEPSAAPEERAGLRRLVEHSPVFRDRDRRRAQREACQNHLVERHLAVESERWRHRRYVFEQWFLSEGGPPGREEAGRRSGEQRYCEDRLDGDRERKAQEGSGRSAECEELGDAYVSRVQHRRQTRREQQGAREQACRPGESAATHPAPEPGETGERGEKDGEGPTRWLEHGSPSDTVPPSAGPHQRSRYHPFRAERS